MKKLILISIVIFFASCKKEYNCSCIDTRGVQYHFESYKGFISPEKACQNNVGDATKYGIIHNCELH